MTIRALRILPPLAIGRLGGAADPVVNYTLEDDPADPLGFRRIVAQETFEVDPDTGAISRAWVPDRVDFKQGEHIRPVAPFLEVFAETGKDTLEPLTLALLEANGLGPGDVQWRGRFGNRKVERRTMNPKDAVLAETPWFNSHERQVLVGHSKNFVKGKSIDFGSLRYVRPTDAHPEVRLRFRPAKGLIYGTEGADEKNGSLYGIPPERRVYKKGAGWDTFMVPLGIDNEDPDYDGPFFNETLPASLFAIVPPAPPWLHGNRALSRGWFDDACDGIVEVALELKDGTRLEASARVTSGPPAVVPDSLFVRTIADDLEQALRGPEVHRQENDTGTLERAADIIRRAHETVRFLNVAVMNGNPVKGRPPLSLDTMPAEEAYDTERLERPVMTPGSVDTLAVMALHQQVFTALRSGTAPWFVRLLRKPEEAGDYSDEGRRKMPALMCGGDNNYLALTHRQIDTVAAAAEGQLFAPPMGEEPAAPKPERLSPRNHTAQLLYKAKGNPFSSTLHQSVGNCTPGLEMDLRASWRRLLEGVQLREYDNLVIEAPGVPGSPHHEAITGLQYHRLMRVAGYPTTTVMMGPSPASPDESVVLSTDFNPNGIAPMEWSNALAHVLKKHVGEEVECWFSKEPSMFQQVTPTDDPKDHIVVKLRLQPYFMPGTAVISEDLVRPGELTQGLCSPWQNDYRECSCYYWASARPDYVNVEAGNDGTSRGDNWLQKVRTGTYVPDDYVDSRMILYDDLFEDWEKWLRFQVRGRDLPDSEKDPA